MSYKVSGNQSWLTPIHLQDKIFQNKLFYIVLDVYKCQFSYKQETKYIHELCSDLHVSVAATKNFAGPFSPR